MLAYLFFTVGVGYLVSRLSFRGVNLGVAAVLFAGIAIGAATGGAIELPEIVGQIGLLLFVYTIGLQAGPSFFPMFRRRGLPLVGLTVAAVAASALVTWGAARLLGLEPAIAAGLFCGATTNTPALAAVTGALGPGAARDLPVVGYSIAYPLGVLVPLVAAELVARLGHLDIRAEARRAERDTADLPPKAMARNLRVTAAAVVGKTIAESPLGDTGVRISRVQHGEDVALATHESRLERGDVIHVVGSEEQLDAAERLVGPAVAVPGPETRRDQVEVQRVFLSSPDFVGRRLGEIEATLAEWQVVITRIRRGDLEFVPDARTRLERGDILRIVARAGDIEALAKRFGDSLRVVNETDFLSISLGVLLGLALGSLGIPLPGGVELRLGLAGGPLLVALVVGWRGRTGPIVWTLPLSANLAFRQFGLVLFFATVGLRSGGGFADALAAHGPGLLLAGGAITLVSAGVLLAGSMAVLRSDWVTGVGTLAGGQTQPAVLAFVGERARSEAPTSAYVAIMPIAMVAKIVAAQLLLFWLS